MHTAMKMKNSKTLDNTAGVLCALGGETLFGLSIIFTKQVTEYADALSLLGWRFLIAFVVMSLCLLLGLIKIDLRSKSLKPLLLVALWSPCIYYISETVGVMYTTASESAVFFACIPVVSLVASTLLLKEKPSKTQAAVLYQGIGCSVLAFFLSNVAISKIGVNRTASFIGFSTVVSILAGALLLHESFTALQTVGVAVILAGVYIANMTTKRTASN